MKKRYKILITITTFILIIAAVFTIWLLNPYQAVEEAAALLEQENIEITEENWLLFKTKAGDSDKGLIFYPGARVEAEAYAPLAAQIAEAGYQVIITPMPLNLAVLGINKADQIMKKYQDIEDWFITGHSLGGAMAANYAKQNSSKLEGLILLAAYPAESDDLSASSLDVLSIYAANDSFATLEDIEESKKLLPKNTVWHKIEGGNHSQFGYYGFQRGDAEAEITREEQQQEILKEILSFIE
ncbi:MAG: alpha/beta family hydrolase [Halanaerobium sp.]